jgi:hypothetical protein
MDTNETTSKCDGCLRLSDCHHWANLTCHDEYVPDGCERYTNDPSVLDNEMIELELLKQEIAEYDRLNPPPF